MLKRTFRVISFTSIMLVASISRADETLIIGGSTPDQRPQGAPVLVDYFKDSAWYHEALLGITLPFPPSFRFLEDQGAWYTPFNHRGMPSPYDIRGLHQQ